MELLGNVLEKVAIVVALCGFLYATVLTLRYWAREDWARENRDGTNSKNGT